MRTVDEIVEYYRREQGNDFFGFTAEVLLSYLTAEQFKEFAKPDADLSEWKAQPLTREYVLEEMRKYMEFAWGKVEDHRGLSAGRSIEKMQAWLWLLGDEETRAFADDGDNYAQYGAPILKKICEMYGFPVPEGEDIKRMSQGLPCYEGCQEGCGR